MSAPSRKCADSRYTLVGTTRTPNHASTARSCRRRPGSDAGVHHGHDADGLGAQRLDQHEIEQISEGAGVGAAMTGLARSTQSASAARHDRARVVVELSWRAAVGERDAMLGQVAAATPTRRAVRPLSPPPWRSPAFPTAGWSHTVRDGEQRGHAPPWPRRSSGPPRRAPAGSARDRRRARRSADRSRIEQGGAADVVVGRAGTRPPAPGCPRAR